MSTPPRPSTSLREYRTALDLGCRLHNLRGIRVWRSIKALSQLLVIGFCFWGAVSGQLDSTLAFGGMIAAYLGAEGVETILLAAGENATQLTIQDESDDTGTDGGATVVETAEQERDNGP